jgi:hypothetical protein
MFQCECNAKFVENGNGDCQIAHGNPCIYDDGAREDSYKLCDQVADLDCKDFRCSCKNEVDVYEPERRQCSVAVGMRCDETSRCVENSSCVKQKNGKLRGKCLCLDGFEVGKNGTCFFTGNDQGESLEAIEIDILESFGSGNHSAATAASVDVNDSLITMKDEGKDDTSSNDMV